MTLNLKLLAQSRSDLAVISAAMQDAILKIGDVKFDKTARTLTFRASRFMHEKKKSKRVQTGVQFNHVLSMFSKNIDRSDPEAFMVLLSIDYVGDKKQVDGEVHLIFAGGGEIRLQIEYIEARLVDYAKVRETDKFPLHPETAI